MAIDKKYIILDNISHILLRPQTYIGSNKYIHESKYVFKNNRFEIENIEYVPSFIKIFDEIITNSVDESKLNKKLNKIDIDVDIENNIIKIKDNGGIPVKIHDEYKMYIPEIIFGNLMSSSNYDNENRIVGGLNGLGAKLTNIFSTEFSVVTCDGKNMFKQIYYNNMREKSDPIIKRSNEKFTEITFKPDLKLFEMNSIDYGNYKMIEKRIYDLAATNNNIMFTLNGTNIKFNSFEDYIKMYNDNYIYDFNNDKSWIVGISISNDGFKHISFVNSIETKDGGTHVDYVTELLYNILKQEIEKKIKYSPKYNDIKNNIMLFLNTNIKNPSFSNQMKDKLITNIKDFSECYTISDKFKRNILKSHVFDYIINILQKKKNNEEEKIKNEINKKIKKIKVEKLIDSKGRNRKNCIIGIFEGDSAISAFRKYRNPQIMGAFALKGKFINISELNIKKILENDEVINLMKSIGLKIGEKANLEKLRYGKILFYVDADVDGNSIAALLINFFYNFWPELFEMNMIYKVETPLVIVYNKKRKSEKKYFYNMDDFNNWIKKINKENYDIKYKKGLASLSDDEYKEIITNPKMILIKRDELSKKYLDIWFGKNTELRKIEILNQ